MLFSCHHFNMARYCLVTQKMGCFWTVRVGSRLWVHLWLAVWVEAVSLLHHHDLCWRYHSCCACDLTIVMLVLTHVSIT